jgi:glycosyltransferase involved in cell wall biosynthesis
MKKNIEELVSIGLPAYNRPEQLKKALESLIKQTYENIEIILSDDCSTDEKVKEICLYYSQIDKRIRYFRQKRNLGPEYNFKFVLDKAEGKYFMWAADDDMRDPECIFLYMQKIGSAGGVFSNYSIRDTKTNLAKEIKIPKLSGKKKSKNEILEFMNTPCPSMIYGLYLTKVAQLCMPQKLFDFWDFYYCMKIINKYGFVTFESRPLYFAGINGKYKLNPFNKKKFTYFEYFIKAFPYVLRGGVYGIIRHIKFLWWIYILNKKFEENKGYID